jgi:hypothetical protein
LFLAARHVAILDHASGHTAVVIKVMRSGLFRIN